MKGCFIGKIFYFYQKGKTFYPHKKKVKKKNVSFPGRSRPPKFNVLTLIIS